MIRVLSTTFGFILRGLHFPQDDPRWVQNAEPRLIKIDVPNSFIDKLKLLLLVFDEKCGNSLPAWTDHGLIKEAIRAATRYVYHHRMNSQVDVRRQEYCEGIYNLNAKFREAELRELYHSLFAPGQSNSDVISEPMKTALRYFKINTSQ